MAGTISSLGIGSGILTNDLLTKLRTGEETARLTPVDSSLTTIKTKQAALSTLMIDLANVKDKAADLSDSMYYLKRTATSTSTDVAITVDSGVRAQSIGIKVTQLAQNDVYQSKGYKSEDDIPSSSDFEITINISGTDKKIAISGGSSLSAIADKINSEADGKYGASILNTGMGTEPYKLILKSTSQGTDNALVISDTSLGLFNPSFSSTQAINGDVQKATYTSASAGTSVNKAIITATTAPVADNLQNGDLVINGTPIRGSFTTSQGLVDLINQENATTQVTASLDANDNVVLTSSNTIDLVVSTNGETATGLTTTTQPTAQLTLGSGEIKINGISIPASDGSLADLVAKIEATSGQTKVNASISGGKIVFTSDYNIKLDITTDTAKTVSGLSSLTLNTQTQVASPTSKSLTGTDLVINDKSINFAYNANDLTKSYNEQLLDTINAATADTTANGTTVKGTGVKASLTNNKLVLASLTNDDIKITTTSNGASVTGLTSGAVTDEVVAKSRLQKAQNSLFEYNGVNMSRSSNSVDDITVGMKLTFNKVMDSIATLDVKQDTSSIVTAFKDFTTNYNTLSAKITELTKYDTDNKKAATFTGQNEITSILSKINTFLTQQNGDGVSLTDMGLSRNEDGTITFNDATLTTKLLDDPDSAEKVLRGTTTYKSAIYTSKNTPDTTVTKLEASDLTINGIYIKWHTFTESTTQARTKELAEYLNTYKGETGVTASVSSDNKLILTDPLGGEINVTATANASKLLGFGNSSISNLRLAIGSSTQENGFFADISDVMKTLMVGSNSSLKLFEAGLQKELTSATKNRASIADQINTRFELMANQFAAYDSVINKYNLMGQQVTAAINALSN